MSGELVPFQAATGSSVHPDLLRFAVEVAMRQVEFAEMTLGEVVGLKKRSVTLRGIKNGETGFPKLSRFCPDCPGESTGNSGGSVLCRFCLLARRC